MADYLAHCRAKGLAPNTVSGAYAFPLDQVFLPRCAKQGITEPDQLTSRTLDRLASDLLENGGARGPLSKATVHSYLRPINSMLAWAREEGEVGSVKAQLPCVPKTLIDVLSRAEIDRLEDTAKSERDKLIIRTLADTGIRVGRTGQAPRRRRPGARPQAPPPRPGQGRDGTAGADPAPLPQPHSMPNALSQSH